MMIRILFSLFLSIAPLFSPLAEATAELIKSETQECLEVLLEQSSAYHKYSALSQFNQEVHRGVSIGTEVGTSSLIDPSFASSIPLVRSFEKEGLYYDEIASWFPVLKEEAKAKLLLRLEAEEQLKAPRNLTRWLQSIKPRKGTAERALWKDLEPRQKLEQWVQLKNPFDVISVKDRSVLFDRDILNFNDVTQGPETPALVTVGDDLGSYEVRLSRGVADRHAFYQLRERVEQYLEGRIGHQHLFHGWPSEPELRKEMAPNYIELLDSTTWFLFWRQMKRDPREIDSILTHPYLGVYTRTSLERLRKALINDEPQRFKDKYRMIGARNFPASPDIPEQGSGLIPDWELRSGNKGPKREFIEKLLIARLSTGDYTGIRAYNSYQFNPSASLPEIVNPWLQDHTINEADFKVLESLQENHPAFRWSPHGRANNHVRNRILSPLLPWQNRLSMDFKKEILQQAQNDYLKGLVKVAYKFEKRRLAGSIPPSEIREKTVEKIEKLIFAFAMIVRLDLDFERYLKPVSSVIPSIQLLQSSGPIDINKLPLGIEYSFRMPLEMLPDSPEDSEAHIRGVAEQFAKAEGQAEGAIQKLTQDGHGHGLAVKYSVPDRIQKLWRFEWDGIQRDYSKKGNIKEAWGGHIEVVTPKFSPESIDGTIATLFQTTRSRGLIPKRSAGGAHVNFDLTELMTQFKPKEGTRRLINLISYFESSEPLILFLWQHPLRRHAAYPIHISSKSARKLYEFKGDWIELGRLLYDIRYFNVYEGRKPKYVPLNLTALMTPILPGAYIKNPLDIRNPTQKWFPSFAQVTGRGEARFFDAPPDEVFAALQIKYARALLNKGLNAEGKILIVQRFNPSDLELWRENPREWENAANQHFRELGLDPAEFRPLVSDSWLQQNEYKPKEKELVPYDHFLPARKKERTTEK